MPRIAHEVNFDGIVGPTHNYAGLSYGNLASRAHAGLISNPREAALQGLAKMRLLAGMGIRQAVLPPQDRPDLDALRRLGFDGSDADVLRQAQRDAPVLLAACASASAMWAANAATFSPSADSADGRTHFTAANLVSLFHRSLEAETTSRILRAIFPPGAHFAHHPPLPACAQFGDEGAANHVRLSASHGEPGIQLFVYGRRALASADPTPARFPARQSREASEAVARLHKLAPPATLFFQQKPDAIDAGAFHNDVVAVGNENVLLYHTQAFVDPPCAAREIRDAYLRCCASEPVLIEVPEVRVPLRDAVRSYLFNSQLVTLPGGGMALVCPTECQEIDSSRTFLKELTAMGTPIKSVRLVDVRQSMHNGGGPACLRLRVVLTEEELAACAPGVFFTHALDQSLVAWVRKHYRDRLHPDDLADPKLARESRDALDELTRLLGIGNVYAFQIGC